MKTVLHNCKQVALAIDQFANAALCAIFIPREKCWADESMSAHAYRMRVAGKREWPEKLINFLLFFDRDKNTGKRHCEMAFESEHLQKQLPPEARQDPHVCAKCGSGKLAGKDDNVVKKGY